MIIHDEEDIDLSDIPEADEEFFRRAKLILVYTPPPEYIPLLRRISISFGWDKLSTGQKVDLVLGAILMSFFISALFWKSDPLFPLVPK